MWAWLSAFLASVVAAVSVLLAVWGTALIVDPAENIHFEYAIPALVSAVVGAGLAVVLWRTGRRRD